MPSCCLLLTKWRLSSADCQETVGFRSVDMTKFVALQVRNSPNLFRCTVCQNLPSFVFLLFIDSRLLWLTVGCDFKEIEVLKLRTHSTVKCRVQNLPCVSQLQLQYASSSHSHCQRYTQCRLPNNKAALPIHFSKLALASGRWTVCPAYRWPWRRDVPRALRRVRPALRTFYFRKKKNLTMVIVVVILGRGGGGRRIWPVQVGRDAVLCIARRIQYAEVAEGVIVGGKE